MILFFKKLKNYFTYGIFEHPVKNELESVDELMNELVNECVDGWMNGCMHALMHDFVNEWTHV